MPATCGTHSGYSRGCRCDPCREAESAYRRLSRERNLVRLAGQPSRTFCNVKSCSNPDHLEAVTASENQRRIHRRKAVCWEAPA